MKFYKVVVVPLLTPIVWQRIQGHDDTSYQLHTSFRWIFTIKFYYGLFKINIKYHVPILRYQYKIKYKVHG